MILFELFIVFFYIGLFTFGGGYAMIPMIQEETISRGWLSQEMLKDFIAISESTPGPFALNIATFIGAEMGGPLGSICATLGVVLPSFIIILIVAMIIDKFLKSRIIQGALYGVRPIVLALILTTGIIYFINLMLFNNQSINLSNFEVNFDYLSFGIFVVLVLIIFAFKKYRKKNLNPIILLLISGVLGLIAFGL